MADLFFYGSLRDHELTEVVLGRKVEQAAVLPASAYGYATRRVLREAYPILVEAPGRQAEGVVLVDLSDADLDRLSFFEEAEYGLVPISVMTDAGPRDALYFQGTTKLDETDADWDYQHWRREDRAVAVEAARELMVHFGRTPVERIDDVWPGIMIRARQRARAKAGVPVLGRLRTAFGPADVSVGAHEHAYARYLGVEEAQLSHRRFDGGWSETMQRTGVLWGDAVTVLPYDPVRERVLLIEQFRAAPALRGDPNPWCIEVIAGRIDCDGSPGEIARRESEEEGGIALGALREIGRYYTTPGLAAEEIVAYVGQADLPGEGGLHGLAAEHEDIRTIVLGLDEALEAAATGAVNTGPALVSLLWLGANRAALRADWSTSDNRL